MEEAILKTLIYYDIFDYPLKSWEIHKWLFGFKVNLNEMEVPLRSLLSQKKIVYFKGYFFLKGREILVSRRIRKEKNAQRFLSKARFAANALRLVPTIKLLGLSGSLAMSVADKHDDIDFFIICSSKRIWLTRLLAMTILEILGLRRRRSDSRERAIGKVCLNLFMEESSLELKSHDLYTAHEILQLKMFWQRQEFFQKFLFANDWSFQLLPNWISSERACKLPKKKKSWAIVNPIMDGLESLAKSLQKGATQVQGDEVIEATALFFHPEDQRPRVMDEYHKKLKRYRLS